MFVAAPDRSGASPPTQLGRGFAEVSLLRAGSRFAIYEAREVESDRVVAVKVPTDAGASWLHDQLEHEARILQATSAHPNVITLHRRITVPDGRPALVLDRCRTTMDDVVRTGTRIPVAQAISIGIKLAGALESVRAYGVAHCDVRPTNVLITDDDAPVLAGFDEAVPLDTSTGYAPLHVTTAHTAPELLEGKPPTPATDVYGLASTLYELIAGRGAFRAYAGESAATVIVRVLSGRVRPIVAPDVPLEVSDLLTWAMSPDPGKRPPTAAWLAEEFGRIQYLLGWDRTHMIVA